MKQHRIIADEIVADEPIELDPSQLLGLSQVVKISGAKDDLGRLLSKIGEGPGTNPLVARLLSKIGETGGGG